MSKAYGYAINKGRAILSGAAAPATPPPMTVVRKPTRPVMPKPVPMRTAPNPAASLLQRRLLSANQPQ